MRVFVIAAIISMASVASGIAQEMVSGEVTKVDEGAGKITIKHGPLKKFEMDGMTMVFKAADPAMLTQFKPGDKIKFDVDKVNGQFTVIKIKKTK